MKDEPSSYQLVSVEFQLLHGEGPGPSPASRRTASLPLTWRQALLASACDTAGVTVMSLGLFAIIFSVLWTAAILLWSHPRDAAMTVGVLTAFAWFLLMGLWL